MADGTVPINPGAGILVDTDQVTVGSNVVQRQRSRLAGAAAAELADVRNAAPGMTDYGQVVRLPGPPGQDFGSIVTPEIGKVYVSGKNRAAIGTFVYQSTVTAGVGVNLISAVVNTKVYMFQVTIMTDILTTFYFRSNNVAGAVRYLVRLNANQTIAIAAPMGMSLCDTLTSEGLWLDCSAGCTAYLTVLYAQV